LHVRTVGLLAEVNEIATALTHERGAPRGVLRVSCPLVFGHIAMSRIAAGFAQRFPDVHLEVTTEDRQVDLIEEGYDVVIRVNPGEDSQLVGRCLHRDTLFVAAPAGLVRPDDPETPIPTVTGSSALDLKRRTVVDGGVERTMTFKSVLRLPSLLMLRDAVLAGAGAGILPHMLVADALASGELQDWGTLPAPKVEVWALHASRRLTSGKVSAFLDFLTEATPAMFSK
jgi:DNA-binding transcriptional LysR family regulator